MLANNDAFDVQIYVAQLSFQKALLSSILCFIYESVLRYINAFFPSELPTLTKCLYNETYQIYHKKDFRM